MKDCPEMSLLSGEDTKDRNQLSLLSCVDMKDCPEMSLISGEDTKDCSRLSLITGVNMKDCPVLWAQFISS